MSIAKNLLVVGGAGNLGKSIVNTFKKTWKVASLDLRPNTQAHHNVLLGDPKQNLKEKIPKISQELEQFSKKYDSILCVAGGWAGGSISDVEIFDQINLMHQIQVVPAILSGHLASKYLSPGGLLVLTGAAGPFKQTAPFMLAYSVAKTAVHSIALNLADCPDLPEKSIVTTILPTTIDTPENRKAMPDEDFSQWSSPDKIAELLLKWSEGKNRPTNGSFAILQVANGDVVPDFV